MGDSVDNFEIWADEDQRASMTDLLANFDEGAAEIRVVKPHVHANAIESPLNRFSSYAPTSFVAGLLPSRSLRRRTRRAN